MIAAFITFRYGEDLSAAKVRELAQRSQAKFKGMAGLRSKLFSLSPDAREARNVYVWDDVEAARAFFTQETQDQIAALYGVQPIIEYAEVCALVENARA